MFSTDYQNIAQKVKTLDPVGYSSTRNYVDGNVSYLSPYISRGVISTKQVLQSLIDRGYNLYHQEKFIQELAWRDYWQQIWVAKGDQINTDLKQQQEKVAHHDIPTSLMKATTGIAAVDHAIIKFYDTGYIHNHIRMYIAAIACNIGQSHWFAPAQWMYYNLLDADWASNALSWQWVAGANSGKKYYAEQANINKFCYTEQHGTYLDMPKEDLHDVDIPNELIDTSTFKFETPLPEKQQIEVDSELPTYIYNFYNLDPLWHQEEKANRILLLEPSLFEQYPVSQKSIDFILSLSDNIEGIQVYIGEFTEMKQEYKLNDIVYKEHPLNQHYKGTEEPRDWMFSPKGYFPSFFAYWKKCRKELKQLAEA
ncbi:FAD-binding domain-containing protein [Sediminitomix flava]|uniref:Deoxyribodipyrimidine photo-lyase n=1 Tax=Sediminitomix flava TaxID=379075 RepID=A0A315ZBZ6_SEDFL|nr:FAD-binding domain-containing protein [Sediminitomix flava]PWJ43096.1 deoxyribodipyrimidine photo-lyase [Sediminitomix flava]